MTKLNELSYSRLMLRTTYYRDRTLNLEKKIGIANEKVKDLKKKLTKIEIENNDLNHQVEEFQEMMDLKHLDKLQNENKLLLTRLEQLAIEQQKTQPNIEQKINEYEELLSSIQTDITLKEQQLDYYKSRVKTLENNSSMYKPPIDRQITEQSTEQENNTATIFAYFDYALISKSAHKLIIRGDFHIKNLGNDSFMNPTICVRFSLPELANLKGKILTSEQVTINKQSQTNVSDWMFLQTDWANEAKERGEIWLAPIEQRTLQQGQTLSLTEFQIPINAQFNDTLIVEGFVYLSDPATKIKSSNNIIISY